LVATSLIDIPLPHPISTKSKLQQIAPTSSTMST
jgi:hypothetical protein